LAAKSGPLNSAALNFPKPLCHLLGWLWFVNQDGCFLNGFGHVFTPTKAAASVPVAASKVGRSAISPVPLTQGRSYVPGWTRPMADGERQRMRVFGRRFFFLPFDSHRHRYRLPTASFFPSTPAALKATVGAGPPVDNHPPPHPPPPGSSTDHCRDHLAPASTTRGGRASET